MGGLIHKTGRLKIAFFLVALFLFRMLPGPEPQAADHASTSNPLGENVSKVPLAGGVINVGAGPAGLAVTPDGQHLYVTNNGDNTVSRIVVATGVVDQVINVGASPVGLAVTPDGQHLYVSNIGDGTVSRIVVASGAVDQVINVGATPIELAVTPDGQHVYVAHLNLGTVSRIVVATGGVDQVINVGAFPVNLAATPDGQHVYVANFSLDTVSRIVVATGGVDQVIDTGDRPQGLAVTPDGQHVYVAHLTLGAVSRIVVASGAVDQVINVGAGPYFLAATPDGEYVYAANNDDDTVSRIVVSTGLADQVIDTGDRPRGLAVTPDGRYLYVANMGDDTVSQIELFVPPPGDGDDGEGTGPDPDPIPPGGPPNQIGGGGPGIGSPLPPGHDWHPGDDDTPHQLTMALAYTRQKPEEGARLEKMEIDIPGLMVQRTDPSGAKEECWLPLGESRTMFNGVESFTRMRWNYDIRVIDLNSVWPKEVIRRMTKGRHRLTYYLQTADGRESNRRFEHLNCGCETATISSARAGRGVVVDRKARELLLRLQVSCFNEQTGFVERIEEGLCEVETEEGGRDAFPIIKGMLTAAIPFGRDCLVRFFSKVFNGAKTVRIEFRDGFMYAYDHDHRDAEVEIYQCLDNESYAIEYFRDMVYICNQGEDPDGPILGRMFGK
jgi:YVTN family beta-propeller protein